MKINRSCSTLSIFAFYEIMKTNELRYLIDDFNIQDSMELTDIELIKLKSIFDEIMSEYAELTSNKNLIKNYYATQKNINCEEKQTPQKASYDPSLR